MQVKNIRKSKSAGFTLIELLIVIIIIGILAAIGFVAYTGSQNRAKKAGAETALSQAKTKLAEYNADQGNYPASESAFTTWLETVDNNAKLADKFETGDYTYEASPGSCDNTATTCTGFTLRAAGSLFGSSTGLEVTN